MNMSVHGALCLIFLAIPTSQGRRSAQFSASTTFLPPPAHTLPTAPVARTKSGLRYPSALFTRALDGPWRVGPVSSGKWVKIAEAERLLASSDSEGDDWAFPAAMDGPEDNVINWRREAESSGQRRWRLLPSGWTQHHVSAFLLTFCSYALFHATRKNFSAVKTTMREAWLPQRTPNVSLALPSSPFADAAVWGCPRRSQGSAPEDGCFFRDGADALEFEGTLDAVFLSAYAVGLFVSGMVGDRFPPRLVLSLGMWASAALVLLFGFVSEAARYYHSAFYVTLWLLSGLVQSVGWPTEVAVMGAWFGRGTRGAVLGLWAACASVGNIVGTKLSAHFLPFGYEYTFLANGALLGAGGVVVFFGLVASPAEVGLPDPEATADDEEKEEPRGRGQPIPFLKALRLPGVISYSLAYACLKLVNYSLFFWLPTYIHLRFGWKEEVADDLSTYYDWGGIVAGFIGGVLTDVLPFRSPVILAMLGASVGALWGYSVAPGTLWWNRVLLGVAGLFVGGPANLISAAVAADLGKQAAVQGSSEALATVTGIVDGTGSVGAALGQVIVPAIINSGPKAHTLHYVFYFFILMTLATMGCLVPLVVREVREWWTTRGGRRRLAEEEEEEEPWTDRSIGDGHAIFGHGSQIPDQPD